MDSRLSSTRSLRPEVGRLWLRRAFREWPGCDHLWTDLAEGRVRTGGGGELPVVDGIEATGGLLYVPPVSRERAPARDTLVASLIRRGVPALVQLAPGETLHPSSGPQPEVVVFDLLETLLQGDLAALEALPPGCVAVWPLVPALTDDEAMWEEGCQRLSRAGASCVQAVVPEIPPGERRALADGRSGDAEFSRLFHGRTRGERSFAATATRHGLGVFFRRRRAASDRRSRNADLAELLALGGELWLRLDRGEVHGQELFRASRWVEESAIDVRALAAEGNLEIVEALRGTVAEIVDQWARTGASATVDAWLREYATPPERGRDR